MTITIPSPAGLLSKLAANKHTTGSAIIYGLAKFGCPILAQWFPNHITQIQNTADLLEAAAIFYGFTMAGDARKSAPAIPDSGLTAATPPATVAVVTASQTATPTPPSAK